MVAKTALIVVNVGSPIAGVWHILARCLMVFKYDCGNATFHPVDWIKGLLNHDQLMHVDVSTGQTVIDLCITLFRLCCKGITTSLFPTFLTMI